MMTTPHDTGATYAQLEQFPCALVPCPSGVCPYCHEKGRSVELVHRTTEEAIANPGAFYGVTHRVFCWYECPECHKVEDCDGSHKDIDDSLPSTL
jgi:hypothetical protein